ncbi:MAG: sugar nucleotide-binding protein [Flavisolibacter sp.]
MDKQYYNPEIWGGIECTINRVKKDFFDQLEYTGHYIRTTDIAAIAALGIKKIRYPLLWEKHQPAKETVIDWTWAQQQMLQLQEENINVIAGLVHHGSGPSFTNLSDPQFPYLLAGYAKKVAAQFPSIQYYTPVNEPLTTARFSGLYGLWYPHRHSAKSFMQMLLHQLKGIVLSMQEIRKINPSAQLVQTEDLGKTYSTPRLKYQARFENERRWLTYDILCGRFTEKHALWNFFKPFVSKEELYFFIDNPCVPNVFGFNHYLTSERYLDERLHLYPQHTHGGNGRHRYADVEAVRVELDEDTGIEVLLREAWNRYQQPMAVTEVHLHSHREEQLRWFKQVWETANKLNAEDITIKAVTTWAMLGSYGWNRLLTQRGGDYEPGAFDLRNGQLRPTALARFIKELNETAQCQHPLSIDKGWWQRSSRILYGPVIKELRINAVNDHAPVLIIGKNGTLGKAFAKICSERCIHYQLLSRQDYDISDPKQIEAAIEHYKPWAIINAAGYVRVDDAERNKEACFRDNVTGPHNLAIACNKAGIQLITFSSDLVFDGTKETPYVESDATSPLNIYGQTKAAAEALVLKEAPASLVIRTSAFFGPWDEYNFVHHVQKSLQRYEPISVAENIFISPTYVPDLVNATLDLLIDKETGIWHLSNSGATTWAALALDIAEGFDLDKSFIHIVKADEMNYEARRPTYSVLGSERGHLLPSLSNALSRYIQEERMEKKEVA